LHRRMHRRLHRRLHRKYLRINNIHRVWHFTEHTHIYY
jgi:hypothetical protein